MMTSEMSFAVLAVIGRAPLNVTKEEVEVVRKLVSDVDFAYLIWSSATALNSGANKGEEKEMKSKYDKTLKRLSDYEKELWSKRSK